MTKKVTAPVMSVLMTDGTQHDIKIAYRSQLQYARTARVRKWPTAEEAPELAANFMAWFTMCQVMGLYDFKLEEFEEHVEWIVHQEEEEELAPGDDEYPTN